MAEDNEEDGYDDSAPFGKSGHGEEERVKDAVGKDGGYEKEYEVLAARVGTEGGESVVIAHEHSETEVAGHREEGTNDAYCDDVVLIGKKISYVLYCREAERDEDRIDYAVGILVIVFVFAQ